MRGFDGGYALGNRLMFFCQVFSPAVGPGSSALLSFLDRRTQRVNKSTISLSIAATSPSDKFLKQGGGLI